MFNQRTTALDFCSVAEPYFTLCDRLSRVMVGTKDKGGFVLMTIMLLVTLLPGLIVASIGAFFFASYWIGFAWMVAGCIGVPNLAMMLFCRVTLS